VPTATPGAAAPRPCSPASAPCWKTTRGWTCAWCPPAAAAARGGRFAAGDPPNRAPAAAAGPRACGSTPQAMDDPRRSRTASPGRRSQPLLPMARGKVDLAAMLHDLAQRGVNELHVKPATSSTPRCCAPAWSTSCWSTWRPRCWAWGAKWPPSGPCKTLSEGWLPWVDVQRVGDDLRIRRPRARSHVRRLRQTAAPECAQPPPTIAPCPSPLSPSSWPSWPPAAW
jgi:hypothetical protein